MSHQSSATPAASLEDINGALALRRRLAESLQEKPPTAPLAQPPRFGSATRRAFKLAIGLAVALGLGWSPLKSLLVPTSVEAVVNARLATLRSPIEGYVEEAPAPALQWRGEGAAPLLIIANPDADRAALTSARREVADAEDRIEVNTDEQQAVKTALAALDTQVEQFRDSRRASIDLRVASLTAEADAASANAAEAEAQWKRARKLRAVGVTPQALEERAETQARAGALAARAAAFKVAEAQVEAQALAKGAFVGDAFNDTPSSDQAARELRLKLASLQAQASALARTKARLAAEREVESADYARRSRALLSLPVSGRVFEALVTRGERVAKGQELMRVLDCESAIVSANVEESVYNRLRVGEKASFKPADGGAAIVGEIVNLTGASAAPGVYAISPASLRKSPFYVSIALPQGQSDCAVGRTGTVTFSKD
jgi:multidrug resistance efflux pump